MPTKQTIKQPVQKQTNGMAIAAMVLGILGIVLAIPVFYIALVLNILAIIFGIIAITKINKNPSLGGKGMAMAGIITGAIGLFIVILMIILVIFILVSGPSIMF